MGQEVLFICTGNYYRSRFAEALFNHQVMASALPWRAFSRGLQIHLAPPGLSPHTLEALTTMQVPLHHTAPERQSLTQEDLLRARRTIALKQTEHYPMMKEQFPTFADQIEYWEVHDIDFADPVVSLQLIGKQIQQLLSDLQ